MEVITKEKNRVFVWHVLNLKASEFERRRGREEAWQPAGRIACSPDLWVLDAVDSLRPGCPATGWRFLRRGQPDLCQPGATVSGSLNSFVRSKAPSGILSLLPEEVLYTSGDAK